VCNCHVAFVEGVEAVGRFGDDTPLQDERREMNPHPLMNQAPKGAPPTDHFAKRVISFSGMTAKLIVDETVL
jgi:hypothetical protein